MEPFNPKNWRNIAYRERSGPAKWHQFPGAPMSADLARDLAMTGEVICALHHDQKVITMVMRKPQLTQT